MQVAASKTPDSTHANATPNTIGADVAAGSAMGFVGRVSGYASQYAFQVTVARVLGAYSAGLFFAFAALVSLLATGARAGLDRIGLRRISVQRATGDLGEARATAVQLTFVVTVISVALTLALLPFRGILSGLLGAPDQGTSLGIILLSIPGIAVSFSSAEFLRGLKRIGLSALVQLILVYLAGIAGLWVLHVTTDVTLVVASIVFVAAATAAALVGVALVWHQTERPASRHPLLPSWRSVSGAPFMLWTALLLLGMGGIDVVLLGHLRPGVETAYYVAAARTALVPSIGLVAVNSIVAPIIAAEYGARGSKRVQDVMRMGARWGLVVASMVVGLILLTGAWPLKIFGSDFVAAHPVLLVLMAGQLVNAGSGAVAFGLLMTGNERSAALILTTVLVLTLPLYFISIPALGALGAALVTATAVALWNAGMIWATRRLLGVTPYADNLVPVTVFLFSSLALGQVLHNRASLLLGAGILFCIAAPIVAWRYLLFPEDRDALRPLIARVVTFKRPRDR